MCANWAAALANTVLAGWWLLNLEFGPISKSLDLEFLRAPLLRASEMQERAAHRPGPCKAALNIAVAEEWALAAPAAPEGGGTSL
jgi:hypothetical protein